MRDEPDFVTEASYSQHNCQVDGTNRKPCSADRLVEPMLGLKQDHESVLNEFKHLRTRLEEMRQSSKEFQALSQSISCANHLVNMMKAHQKREEQILLPVIKKSLDEEICSSILAGHDSISSALEDMIELAESLGQTPSRESVEKLIAAVARSDTLTRAHFSNEENVLFWFASLRLSDDKSRPESSL